MEKNIKRIATELNLNIQQVEVVIDLLAEGATIPFMARYRKEMTGSLDEVVLAAIRDRHEQLVELDKRKEAILKSINCSWRSRMAASTTSSRLPVISLR